MVACAVYLGRTVDTCTRGIACRCKPLAVYSVLKSQAQPPIVWIVDHDGARTITNDAEAVCRAVHAEYPGHRIVYRDTAGFWDELAHDGGVFLTFAPARDLAPQEPA